MEKSTQSKEIPYQDKGYTQKRKILRRHHYTNSNAMELVNMVKYKIIKKIKDNKFVDKDLIISSLLIDGFIAYEKIFDNNDELIGLSQLDPTSLSPQVEGGVFSWVQNGGTNKERTFTKNQIIYISTSIDYTSFVEMVYLKMVDNNSKYTIKLYVDNLINLYNKNFL